MLHIIEAGEAALDTIGQLLKAPALSVSFGREEVRLLAPVPLPPQMRDFLCFEQHLRQAFEAVAKLRGTPARIPQVWYERPIYYHPSRFSVCGTETDVPWPAYTERLDYELEFGCYIAKRGKDIPRERAREYIFGYTIFNDFSARDEQSKEMAGQLGPGKGKDFDHGNAMGPCLVTAEEIGDPYRLEMIARVNGEEWGRGNSRDMHWQFEDCIAHASRSETLHVGEFFGSGTVGNGCGRTGNDGRVLYWRRRRPIQGGRLVRQHLSRAELRPHGHCVEALRWLPDQSQYRRRARVYQLRQVQGQRLWHKRRSQGAGI